MAKYDITYACGHTDTIQLVGPTRDREWRLAREQEKLCQDCWQAKLEADRQEANAKAAAANQAAGLPPLEGTEKQIAWAETIRKRFFDLLAQKMHWDEESKKLHAEEWARAQAIIASFKSHTDATWWIDNRDSMTDAYHIDRLAQKEYEALERAKAEPPAAVVESAMAEATVYPDKQRFNLIAEIKVTETGIEARYPERNDTFYEIVRKLRMEWAAGRWVRKCTTRTGSPVDRAAELGNTLLRAGFPVRLMNAEARQKAIEGTFEPEQAKWILLYTNGEYKGWLCISWPRNSDRDYYTLAKRLEGSRYAKPNVAVPVENYENVLGFAETYGFSVSAKAQEAIDAARAARERALVTGAKPPVVQKPQKPEPVQDVIADEFRDDD